MKLAVIELSILIALGLTVVLAVLTGLWLRGGLVVTDIREVGILALLRFATGSYLVCVAGCWYSTRRQNSSTLDAIKDR
jgi:hypothetical protein